MSISYTLYLRRQTPPEVSPGKLVWMATGPVGEPSATYTAEDFGIRPTCSVRFRPDKWNPIEARAELASLVGEILRQDDDDALLVFNGELPLLRRKQGRVVLSSRSPWTTPEEISQFGLCVEIEDLGAVV